MKALWRVGLLVLLLPLCAAAEVAPGGGEVRALEDFPELLSRPLFSNTRRPALFQQESGVSLDEQQLRDSWRLVGIVLRGERQLALFHQRQGDARQELEVGMPLESDWVLEHIGADHVLLLRNQTTVQLMLREPPVPGAQEADAAAPPPANEQNNQNNPSKQNKQNNQTAPASTPAAPATPVNVVPAPAQG